MTYQAVRSEAKASHDKRQHMYKHGGEVAAEDVHKHEAHLHKGEPKTKLKRGGEVEGRARGGRADRPGKSGKTQINIVMPQGGGDQPHPMPVPMPAGPPQGAMPPRPPMPMPPPQGGMGAMPPGAPPPGAPMMPRKRGGRMTAGAGSGEGRIEKAEGKR